MISITYLYAVNLIDRPLTRRARAPPKSGAVDVDDEVCVALPGYAAGIACLATVPGGAAGPDWVPVVAVLFLLSVRIRELEAIDVDRCDISEDWTCTFSISLLNED